MAGNSFHFLTPTGVNSITYGGIVPPPVVLDVNYPIIDGQPVTVTATSGQLHYMIVDPHTYPLTEDERQN